MTVWLLLNTCLSLLALGCVRLMPGSPHRLRFHICFAALCGWLVPWYLAGGLLPDLGLSFSRASTSSSAPETMGQSALSLSRFDSLADSLGNAALPALLLLSLVGLGLFLLSVWRYRDRNSISPSLKSYFAPACSITATSMSNESGC